VAGKGHDATNAASRVFSALQTITSSDCSIHSEEMLLDDNELAAERIVKQVKQDDMMADDGITDESKAITGGQSEADAGGVTMCDVNTVKAQTAPCLPTSLYCRQYRHPSF